MNIRACHSGEIANLEVIGNSIPIMRQPTMFTIRVDNGKFELITKVPIKYLIKAPSAPPVIIAIILVIKVVSV